jgi:peptidoglycan-associated lipoprotein
MSKIFRFSFPVFIGLLFSACSNSTVWEETKTAGRYINKKGLAFFNQDTDSKLVQSRADFSGPQDDEFIPLKDQDARSHSIETVNLQPKDFQAEQSNLIPQMKQFKDPSHALAGIFKNVYFNTDDDMLRSKEYFQVVTKIADYLKSHPNVYIFVAGHCDERASDDYNTSLGSKRANFIRNLLVKEGVAPERVYTISYGKKQPLVEGHSKAAWAKNRRVEFKIFDKTSVE